jgi:hypothetical protein
LSWKLPLHSFALPVVYLIWTALHGALAGFYPYPFLNLNRIGYEQALMNVAGLIVGFVCLVLALVGIGRLFSGEPHPEEHARSRACVSKDGQIR